MEVEEEEEGEAVENRSLEEEAAAAAAVAVAAVAIAMEAFLPLVARVGSFFVNEEGVRTERERKRKEKKIGYLLKTKEGLISALSVFHHFNIFGGINVLYSILYVLPCPL